MMDVEHKGIWYKEITITNTGRIFSTIEIQHLKSKIDYSMGACLKNAIVTAQMNEEIKCVEGFVYHIVADGGSQVIRHCWNRMGENYFDVTKDYAWGHITQQPTQSFYFVVEEYAVGAYSADENGRVKFLSNVVTIAEEINDEMSKPNKQVL